ncbi:F-box protein SKIP14-like [Cornus florida]|uniref:F-box protein SKIP14-like n=1 Tax=Cornus florida TaxID=4283 RepID=UPI00289A60F0|nr:F-box protein SKIP14-like [Cornus florida]
MTLNFSHRPVFPAHLSEDNFVSPMRIADGYLVEGIPERNEDSFVRPWHLNREVEDCLDYGRDRIDRGGSPESVSKDILDLLPSDPFGMGISSTFTAITGWLEDLEVDYNSIGARKEDYDLLAGLNWIWNKAVTFQAFTGNMQFDENSNTVRSIGGCSQEKQLENAMFQGSFASACCVQDIVNTVDQQVGKSQEGSGICCDKDGRTPHMALPFALSFLGVRDLLSMERVCESLRSMVRSDPLLWRSIHIDQPLNEKITDDILWELTSRAQGNLQCLSLVECPRITDDGLKHVLETNPKLTKLCVPGCTRLSIEGIVNSLKALKSKGSPGIKYLRIGGLYGITDHHFEELKSMLGTDRTTPQNGRKPHFYHRGNFYLLCDDDRAIDIEVCPRCQKLRLVYDCPAEGCQGKDCVTQLCRACTLCIARCVQCGRCINDSEYEETFCLEFLCSGCFKQLRKSQARQDKKIGLAKNAVLDKSSDNFCLHG